MEVNIQIDMNGKYIGENSLMGNILAVMMEDYKKTGKPIEDWPAYVNQARENTNWVFTNWAKKGRVVPAAEIACLNEAIKLTAVGWRLSFQ